MEVGKAVEGAAGAVDAGVRKVYVELCLIVAQMAKKEFLRD